MSTTTNAVGPSATTAHRLLERGLRLEYATLAWNVVGSVVVITAAVRARSVGLAGFGLDSLVEIVASLVVVWQLRGIASGRERRALRIIGISFFVLVAYIAPQSVYVLIAGARPHHCCSESAGSRRRCLRCSRSPGEKGVPVGSSATAYSRPSRG
jgi:hypothetical protein